MEIDEIVECVVEVVSFIQEVGFEVCFSIEDSFCLDEVDLLCVYSVVDVFGVDCVGIVDMVGCVMLMQVVWFVCKVRDVVCCDIEFYGYDDMGCVVVNVFCVLEQGVSYVDILIFGIGECNGIMLFGVFIVCMVVVQLEEVWCCYDLLVLCDFENYVVDLVGVDVFFNNCVIGFVVFIYKVGIYVKVIFNNLSIYEIFLLEDFGFECYVYVVYCFIGWNVLQDCVVQLGFDFIFDELWQIMVWVKVFVDMKWLSFDDVDVFFCSVEVCFLQVVEGQEVVL